jgi:hypothetical protein
MSIQGLGRWFLFHLFTQIIAFVVFLLAAFREIVFDSPNHEYNEQKCQ